MTGVIDGLLFHLRSTLPDTRCKCAGATEIQFVSLLSDLDVDNRTTSRGAVGGDLGVCMGFVSAIDNPLLHVPGMKLKSLEGRWRK
ncbi:unnamed protein product [Linum trigynum]|uniref:Uncharacterized protein n=1 Tax=Linum trigynum TaxID=586398 RepID=A0AAV2EM15_9ROSI